MPTWTMCAQASGRWTAGRVVVWVAVAVLIYGLYRLNAARRKSADEAYWRGRRREEELRRNDPDMARDDPSDGSRDDDG